MSDVSSTQKVSSWKDIKAGHTLYRLPYIPILSIGNNIRFSTEAELVIRHFFAISYLIEPEVTEWLINTNECSNIVVYDSVRRHERRNDNQRFISVYCKSDSNFQRRLFIRNNPKYEGQVSYIKGHQYYWGYDENEWAYDENGFLYTYDFEQFQMMSKDLFKAWESLVKRETRQVRKYTIQNIKKKNSKKEKYGRIKKNQK